MKPYYERDGITIYHGKCEEVLPLLGSVDCVITDPPYSKHTHSKNRRGGDLPDGNRTRANGGRVRELGFAPMTPALMTATSRDIARLCKRWALVFSDVELSYHWRRRMKRAGLQYVRTGAWIKVGGAPQFTGDRPAVGFEAITIMHPKGRKRWNGGGSQAVWQYPIVINRDHRTPRLHTTQKPLPLMNKLVSLFSNPGELILDAYMGSGTTLAAAKLLGRAAIGIEMEEAYCEIAALRLETTVPLPMPEQVSQPRLEAIA